jgi:hypothetical protein
LYELPIDISKSGEVKVAAFAGSKRSQVITVPVTKQKPSAGKKKVKNRGLRYDYITLENQKGRYINNWQTLVDGKVEHSGVVESFGLEKIEHRKKFWGVVFKGYFYAKSDGLYSFFGHGTRQFMMKIHDERLIEEWNEDYGIEGQVLLKKGWHPIEIYHYVGESGTPCIQLLVEGPNDIKKPLSPFLIGYE